MYDLPKGRVATINPETEAYLLSLSLWPDIIVNGNRIIDGLQRYLVAKKYNLPLSVTRVK